MRKTPAKINKIIQKMDDRQTPVTTPVYTPQQGVSLDAVDDNQTVSFYASNPQTYSVETLDVHESVPQNQIVQPPRMKNPMFMFSKRKAMVISTGITLLVVLLTGASMLFLVRNSPSKDNVSNAGKQQDVLLKDTDNTNVPTELQGTNQSLLVNGDFITRGSIKVSSGGFVTVIKADNVTSNQALNLPNASGTICLDSNNCSYVGGDQFAELQSQVTALSQVAIPAAGVTALNNQAGDVAIQGSLNQINVATSDGIVTLSTPQDLDANANVQFGNLTVGPGGEIKANKLTQTSAGNSIDINAGSDMITFTAGGRVFQFPNSGALSQTICTSGASCAVGGGTAVLLSQPTAQSDPDPEASIFINDTGGGHLIRLQSGGVDRLAVANNGDTTVSGSLTVSSLGNGFVKSTGGAMSVVSAIDLSGADVTNTLPVTKGGTGAATLTANGVLVGNGASALTSVAAGGAGLCLISTAGAPSWQACPGAGGSSINLAADSGTPETVANGDTLTVAGGNNISTSVSATDTVTVGTVNNPNFTTSVTTPLLQSSGALSITPGGALTVGATTQAALLQGSTTTITSNGATNDIVLTSADQIRLTGFNCAAFGNGGKLTTDISGNISCAADNGGSGSAITGTSVQTGRLATFTGAQTIADSWILQNGSTVEIDNTRNLSLLGGNFSVVGTGLFSGLVTANGGLTIEAGDTFTFNGEAFSDLTGDGLQFNSGSLQTSLGTSVDLTSEVINVLPVANGGTGLNSSTAANGQLLVGNGTGFTLASITQGTGITITNGAGSITVASTLGVAIDSTEITDLTITNADIANGTINLGTKTTGNYVATVADSGSNIISVGGSGSNNAAVTLGLVADSIGDAQLTFNTGQNLTTASAPSFAGLTVTGGTFTVGTVSQLASLVLHDGNGQTTTLQPGNSTGNLSFTLPSADGALNQCIKTNASGALSFGDCLASVGGGGGVTGSGTQNRLSKFDASGTNIVDSTISDDATNVTTSVDLIVQGGGLTLGTAIQNAALTLYGNGFTANIDTSAIDANNSYNLPAGVGGDFCIRQLGNCSGSGGGNAPASSQYLTLALDAGLSAERTLSFNGTNFSVVDNGANNSYTVNTAQGISTAATPSFAGLTLTGNLQMNANTIQGTTAVIDFTNFDVASTGNVTAGTYNSQTISSAASLTGTLAVAGLTTLNGGLTVEAGDTLTVNGDAFTDLTGNGLQVTTNTLTLLVQASKGVEVDGSGLSLIDCTLDQILKYNGTNQWACAADAGGSGVGDNVLVNGTGANDANFVNTAASGGTVAATTFALNVVGPDQISLTVGVASATDAGVITAGAQTFGGAKTFNGLITAGAGVTVGASQNLTVNGDAVQDLTGNGLQVTTNSLTLLTQANKGLEVDGSGLSLIDCTLDQILKYNGTNQWACAADAGAGGTGDDVYANGVALTNADFLNVTSTATVTGVTWSVNAINPDQLTFALSAASATNAGTVTSNAQTFGGAKTFNGQIIAGAGVDLGAQTLQGTTAVIDFTNFDVASNGNVTAGTYNGQTINSTASLTGTLAVAGLTTLNGGLTIEAGDTLTVNSDAFTDLTGSGLQVSTNTLTILTQANKGLEVDVNGLSLVDCALDQVLKYNGTNQWACAADAGGTGLGDDVLVNGNALTGANFINTAASATNASITWGFSVVNPDTITLALGAASGTDAGIVTATGSQTFGGAKTFNGNLTLASTASLAVNKGTDYSTTGSQNNVAISTASLYRLTGASAQTINGIVAGRDGQTLTLINAGASPAILTHLAGGQTAGNQISTGTAANITLPVSSSISLIYDTTAALWRVIGDASDSGCSTCASTDLSNIASTNLGSALNKTSGNLQLQTTTSGDITLTTAVNTGIVNVLTGSLKVGNGTPDVSLNGEDAYVEGTLEVDGTARFDGALTVNAASTFNSTVALNDNVTLATGKTLTIVGGNTLSRNALTPAEGMTYYDTDTKRIMTYSNGKWQADRGDAIYVAASDSSQNDKDAADYLADGNTGAALDGDQVQINSALTAASGKKVVLLAGTYTIDGSISIPNNTTLSGVGPGTLITIPNALNTNFSAIVNTDTTTGTGVSVQDLRLDGNKSQQATAVGMSGIDFNNMGGGSGTSARPGAKIRNIQSNNWYGGAVATCQLGAGICIRNSNNNTISDNTTEGNATAGIMLISSSHNNITGNTAQGSDNMGIYMSSSSFNTITGNTLQGNTLNGVFLSSSSNNTITGNTANTNAANGFSLLSSNNNIISGNAVSDAGGAAANNAISLTTSDGNTVTGNNVTDTSCTTTCSGLVVTNSTSDNNYFANNGLNGAGISDNGTGTILGGNIMAGGAISGTDATRILAGQENASGNYQLQPSGTIELMKTTNITGSLTATVNADFEGSLNVGTANAFAVNSSGVVTAGTWNGSTVGVQYGGSGAASFTQYGVLFGNGTSAFGVTAVGSTGQCLISGNGVAAPSWGTCTVSSLQSVYNASSPADITLTDNKNISFTAADTATDSSIIMKLNCTACGTGATGNFLIQNNSAATLFSVAGSGAIQIGTTSNGITLAGSGGTTTGSFTLNGTARNQKSIVLTPEFAGAVLDAASDTAGSCNTNNNGTMTSGFDNGATPKRNYYQWTTTQTAAMQCYDVIVQVPIPKDWDGWVGSDPLEVWMMRTTPGSSSAQYAISIIDGTNAFETNYPSGYTTPASPGTSWGDVASGSLGANYTSGDYMTIKIRMSGQANSTNYPITALSNITLRYYSKF